MEEVRFTISKASRKVEVESHVLRYWEDELELPINRNELGHRLYKEADIELLKAIKQLKEQGFQLKAIKMLLPNIHKLESLDSETIIRLKDKLNGKVLEMFGEEKEPEQAEGTSLVPSDEGQAVKDTANDKMGQFKAIMNQIIMNALKDNNMVLSESISVNVTDSVIKEMNFLMRLQEEKEEERFKKFDATLRDYQKSRAMAAATLDGRGRKKSKFFKKHKVYI